MTLPRVETVEPMPGPYELLDLGDGGSKTFSVTAYKLGRMEIHRRDGAERSILVLRVHVPKADKAYHPGYWDITGQTLIDQLLPFVQRGDARRNRFTVTKHGYAPTARFTLEVSPA